MNRKTIVSRRVRRGLRLVAVAGLLAAAAPSGARAAELDVITGTDGSGATFHRISYRAAHGEDNRLTASQPSSTEVILRDVVPIAVTGCAQGTPSQPGLATAATCSLAGDYDWRLLSLAVGDGDNEAANITNLRSTISGLDATRNVFTGGGGRDVIIGGPGNDRLNGQSGDDELSGEGGNDLLVGLGGEDLLRGGADNDTLDGGSSADRLQGGEGLDWADYSAAVAPIVVSLGGAPGEDGYPGEGDSVEADVENLTGGSADDLLTGSDGPNTIHGRGGDDELAGGGGPDWLHGSEGDDTISGLAGPDRLFGEGGADTLRAADGVVDSVECGGGDDVASDADLEDGFLECEHLPQPATPGGGAGGADANAGGADAGGAVAGGASAGRTDVALEPMRIASSRLRLRRGYATVRIVCPASALAACRGTLVLARGGRTLGTRPFAVAPGVGAAVRISTARALRHSLSGPGRLSAVALTRLNATGAGVVDAQRQVMLIGGR